MTNRRCKNCTWWDNKHVSVGFIAKVEWKPSPGFCRKNRPSAILIAKNHIGIQPVMDAEEFCKEFMPDKEG